jgi:Family of unknown function (DUF6348)
VLEIDLNPQFADLLRHHGIGVEIINGFIHTDLPDKTIFRARTVYGEVNKEINSRLDVMARTDKGEEIYESCGDYGATIEEAVMNNFRNFSASSLHPLLVALGCIDPHSYNQITIEEWEINGKVWKAYIGNLVPKMLSDTQNNIAPPAAFFDAFESGIRAQQLTNRLHWFRAYYSQIENEITNREFLMDNELVAETDMIFSALPILPRTRFYSCRNFIILRDKTAD